MEIKVFFSDKEMKTFLEKKGYILEERVDTYWDQWGNHDNQGEWVEYKKLYAVKKGEQDRPFKDVFESLIEKKMKNTLLEK